MYYFLSFRVCLLFGKQHLTSGAALAMGPSMVYKIWGHLLQLGAYVARPTHLLGVSGLASSDRRNLFVSFEKAQDSDELVHNSDPFVL